MATIQADAPVARHPFRGWPRRPAPRRPSPDARPVILRTTPTTPTDSVIEMITRTTTMIRLGRVRVPRKMYRSGTMNAPSEMAAHLTAVAVLVVDEAEHHARRGDGVDARRGEVDGQVDPRVQAVVADRRPDDERADQRPADDDARPRAAQHLAAGPDVAGSWCFSANGIAIIQSGRTVARQGTMSGRAS